MSKIIRKIYVNKKNGQMSITIPKKMFSKPTLKFAENLFAEVKIWNLKREEK